MRFNYSLEVLTVIAIFAFCAIFLYTSSTMSGAEFSGSDNVGSGLIAKLSGTPVEKFQPLIPQWEPPSKEIESCLFAFQAAIGGILVGGVFGFWIGQKKKA
ncbi:MAG: energy-coupling factor ABC transporter substrate-binding protein [Methanoregula sp.]